MPLARIESIGGLVKFQTAGFEKRERVAGSLERADAEFASSTRAPAVSAAPREAWLKNQEINWNSPIRRVSIFALGRKTKCRRRRSVQVDGRNEKRLPLRIEMAKKKQRQKKEKKMEKTFCKVKSTRDTAVWESEEWFWVKSNGIIMKSRTGRFNFQNGWYLDAPSRNMSVAWDYKRVIEHRRAFQMFGGREWTVVERGVRVGVDRILVWISYLCDICFDGQQLAKLWPVNWAKLANLFTLFAFVDVKVEIKARRRGIHEFRKYRLIKNIRSFPTWTCSLVLHKYSRRIFTSDSTWIDGSHRKSRKSKKYLCFW